jgi:hypothetical protein
MEVEQIPVGSDHINSRAVGFGGFDRGFSKTESSRDPESVLIVDRDAVRSLMRLLAISLKKTSPEGCHAGPSTKAITASIWRLGSAVEKLSVMPSGSHIKKSADRFTRRIGAGKGGRPQT